MDQDQRSPWKGKDPSRKQERLATSSSNVGSSGIVQQSEGRMRQLSSSSTFSCSLGRPRPPLPRGDRDSLESRRLSSSGLYRRRGLGWDGGKGVLGSGDPSTQRVKIPFLPPKKRTSKSPPHSQHGNGGDDNSSQPPVKMPLVSPEKSLTPPPLSSTKAGLRSHVTTAMSAPPPSKSSDVDVSMRQRNDQGDALGLSGWMARKRSHAKTSLPNVEEVGKVTRKKTRLDWGQGLAKYEKEQKELNALKLLPDRANGEPDNSSTSITETVACTAAQPASSRGCSPPPGASGTLVKNSTSMTEMMVCEAAVPALSGGCSLAPAAGDTGDLGNSSTSLAGMGIYPAEVPAAFSSERGPQPAVGGNSNPRNSSMSMAETVVCPSAMLASSQGCSLPPEDTGGLGNRSTSLTETVVCPAKVPAFSRESSPPPAVGCNSDGNSSTSMTEAVVCQANVPASSHGCSRPSVVGSNGDLGNNSMSFETVDCPAEAPALSRGCSPPPVLAPQNIGARITQLQGAGADTGLKICVTSAETGLKISVTSTAGDNSPLGNSSTRLIETVVCPPTVLASSHRCSPPPDGSNATSTKVQDIPHKLCSQRSNKIQNSSRMPAIIHEMLQEPKKSIKKNLLSKKPQTYELEGSRFNAWSQEEKDVFSKKFTTFGMDFTKISSFLRQKTTADCIEYYSKNYKSESSKQAEACLTTMKQLQEKCNDENDAAPFMSGIATVTATKNYGSMKTMAEDIKEPVNQICHESTAYLKSHTPPDKGNHFESSMKENEHVAGNVLVGEMNASPQGVTSPITNFGQAVCLTVPKIEEPVLKNLNEESYSNKEFRKGEQEIWTDDERCHLSQAIKKHGNDFASISVYVGTKSSQQCKNFVNKFQNDANLGKTHVRNINSTIGTNYISISNMDSAMRITKSDSKVNGNVSQPVMNPDHGDGRNYLAGGSSGQDTFERMSFPESCADKLEKGTVDGDQIRSGNVNSQKEIEKVDIISSPEGNYINESPMQTSDEAPKISHLSSNSPAAAALQNAKSSRVKMDIDLNIPLDMASLDVSSVELDTNRAEASMGLNAPSRTTPYDSGTPDASAMQDESDKRARTTIDSGANSETANDVTHVQRRRQSQTTIRETTNQPRCIMLFGQVIYQASSSDTNLTFNQDNQIDGRSRHMPSNMVVPFTTRDHRVYPSGPWNTWRSVNVNPSQQPVLSNRVPYGLSNGAAAWPLRPGSSALVNMSQQRQPVYMTPYSMMRGSVHYHLRPGSSSSSLVNFNNFNPGQQQWPNSALDISRMVTGYPYMPESTGNQSPTVFMPSRINGEVASTSNTRFPAARRERAHNPWLAFRR